MEPPQKKLKRDHINEAVVIINQLPDLPLFRKNITVMVNNGFMCVPYCVLKEYKEFFKIKMINLKSNIQIKESINVLTNAILLLKIMLDGKGRSDIYQFKEVVTTVSQLLSFYNLPAELRNDIALTCEKFLQVTDCFDCDDIIFLNILQFLLELTLGKFGDIIISSRDINRIVNFKEQIIILNLLLDRNEYLRQLLLCSTICPLYLESTEGRDVIAHVLVNKTCPPKLLHDLIKSQLPKLTEDQASGYGEVYFKAWTLCKQEELRKIIEEDYIQATMETVFSVERNGLEMADLGQKIFAILSRLHAVKSYRFCIKIADLYEPLIWKFLESKSTQERCNAAEVFFNAFPLKQPDEIPKIITAFREKQVRIMMALLQDDNYIIRIIAIKGIFYQFCKNMEYLCETQVSELLKILAEKLSCDNSVPEVQIAVLKGMETLIPQSCYAAIIINIMKKMNQQITNSKEKVRGAFEALLQKLKATNNKAFKFNEFIPVKRLALPNTTGHRGK